MDFKTTQPVVVVNSGTYERNGQPMTRGDGSPVTWLEVIGANAPAGTPSTQIPCSAGHMAGIYKPGDKVNLVVSLRTENAARVGKNGSPYVATVVKQRVEHIEPVGKTNPVAA